MNVVLIGASDRSVLWRHGKIKEKNYSLFVKKYALFLNKYFKNIILTPDDGIYIDIATKFSEIKKN